MNIRPNRIFPQPVLWFINDDYKDSDFSMEYEVEESFGHLRISYEFNLSNSDLRNLIVNKEAAFLFHVECPLSMYRKRILTHTEKGQVHIETKDLHGKVEILPVIVALKDFTAYANRKLHEDYHGLDLIIKKGSIMALGDSSYLQLDKENHELGRRDSIFSFVKNKKDEPMKIDTDLDKIVIKLKGKDFNSLQMLQSSNKYQPLIYAMFIIPALIFALDSIEEDLEIMREKLWFRSLEKVFMKNGVELNGETVRNRTSYALAQLLLEDPISSALDILTGNGGDLE